MLVDDHRMLREALCGSLAAEPGVEVIGETNSGLDALAALEQVQPDVLVLDIGLGDISGIEVARTVAKRHPAVRIVALSGHADTIYVEEMLRAGALGYVVKSAGADELISAIRAAFGGHSFLSSEVAQVMARRTRAAGEAATPPSSILGSREKEVLRLLADGRSSARIAAALGIAEATVEVHRRNIKRKLGVHSTAELIRYAIHEGLVPS
jgi:two-component system NarL family response regulator